MELSNILPSGQLKLGKYAKRHHILQLNSKGQLDFNEFKNWVESLDFVDTLNIINSARFEK